MTTTLTIEPNGCPEFSRFADVFWSQHLERSKLLKVGTFVLFKKSMEQGLLISRNLQQLPLKAEQLGYKESDISVLLDAHIGRPINMLISYLQRVRWNHE